MRHCGNFCHTSCVDGHCPIALADDMEERGLDIIHSCDECNYYTNKCIDCIFENTTVCTTSQY